MKIGDYFIRSAALQIAHASIEQAGKVNIHAKIILPAIPHLTADNLFVAPTPNIVDEIICVVERGRPTLDAISITVPADASAANP